MSIQVSAYSIPKNGHQTYENQDASWPRFHPKHGAKTLKYKDKDIPESGLIFVVSDGASEGLFSGIWARIVASCATPRSDYNKSLNAEVLQEWVHKSLDVWGRFIRKRMLSRMKLGVPITKLPSWLEKPALEEGGFATLAALQIKPKGAWSAIAVGDSCIFQVRSKKLQFSFPIRDPIEFETRPYLLSSVHGIDEETQIRLKFCAPAKKKNRWKSGDRFYIMSDALACCFLKRCMQGAEPWIELNRLETDGKSQHFDDLVTRWRDEFGMRNDDVTLIRIDVN
jgi:hypothetical protein